MAAEQWVWCVIAAAALGSIIIPVVWLLLYHCCCRLGEENLERDWSRLERIEEKLIAVEKLLKEARKEEERTPAQSLSKSTRKVRSRSHNHRDDHHERGRRSSHERRRRGRHESRHRRS